MKRKKLKQLEEEVEKEAEERKVTPKELDRLERQLDELYSRIDIDVEFTKHFIERLNDKRNKTQIKIRELRDLFRKSFRQYKDELKNANVDFEGVLNDISSDINLPFVIVWDKKDEELDLVSKTVMRKKNFKTSDKKLTVK